jgi:hypothetical protein
MCLRLPAIFLIALSAAAQDKWDDKAEQPFLVFARHIG